MPTMSGNSERAQRQADLPIQVIVGNPPWSTGQKSAGDDNPNVPHKRLADRITETYAARSTATLKNSLQDLYKMAIRWATDRLGERGIIAFVTPNGYIDGNAEAGMRACLADEFTVIHVFNLRGAVQQAAWRREGGKVFESNSTVGTAITIMVRNPDKTQNGCRIFYRDIGDYLSTQEKRQMLVDLGSMEGIDDWQTITPDRHNDWINQRDTTWETLLPLGHKETKANKPGAPDTMMQMFSPGITTGGDTYIYSFDDLALADGVEQMTAFYEQQRKAIQSGAMALKEATANDSLHFIKWTDTLKRKIKSNNRSRFQKQHLRAVSYRPFIKQWLYFDTLYIDRPGRVSAMFPAGTTPNQVIYITGPGASVGFSTIITDTPPDRHILSGGQAFPRYVYPGKHETAQRVPSDTNRLIDPSDEHGRVDNITDQCLLHFHYHYNDPTITKDNIWAYIYGTLHAPDWRNKYANDLRKDLPRIPLAPDLRAFQKAGQQLINLHLSYEACKPWPLDVVTTGDTDGTGFYRIDRTMRWGKVRNGRRETRPRQKRPIHQFQVSA